MAYTPVNLTDLPPPQMLESIDYEVVLAEMKKAVAESYPPIAPVLEIESEPAVKVLEICAAYVMLTRARVNDAYKGGLLAFATGSDLDHLGAMLGVSRLDGEADEQFRSRIQLAPEAFSTAGPRGSYEYHAISADPDVKDVLIAGPSSAGLAIQPGEVHIYVLSKTGDGTASTELLSAVEAAVNAEIVRPLTDTVIVRSAVIAPFEVEAVIHAGAGPAAEAIKAEAQAALVRYLRETHRVGGTVALSGIHAALHRPGVERVEVITPVADIIPAPNAAPHNAGITITVA